MTTAQGGGKVVSLTHRPHLRPGNTPGTCFCQRLSRPQGNSAIRRIYVDEKFHATIWNRTSDLLILAQYLNHCANCRLELNLIFQVIKWRQRNLFVVWELILYSLVELQRNTDLTC
jgi:hypothetical protein